MGFEYEWECEGEGELEGEWEFEGELEGELEGEEFLGRLAALAVQGLRSPTLRRLGGTAARAALRGGLGALRGPMGRRYGGGYAGAGLGDGVGSALSDLLPPGLFEGEGEFEFEDELLLNPARRAYTSAVMAHLGHAAAQAPTEAEAEAFLGALIPMAARLIPRIAPAVMRVAPQLARGVVGIGRTLLRSPTARSLVQAVPGIVQGTMADLARQTADGQPITPAVAAQTLARRTFGTLSSPGRSVRAVRQARALDRRYHGMRRCCTCR